MHTLEKRDIWTQQDFLYHEAHCLEPKVKLSLLEKFLGFSITPTLQELEESATYCHEILEVISGKRMECLERITVFNKHVKTTIDLIVRNCLLQ